jgi:selenocysteine lyase/cysteine desulfurase
MQIPTASLAPDAFAPATTYLNTAASGLLPATAADAVRMMLESTATGAPSADDFDNVARCRASFARLTGVPETRVAAGASVAVYAGLVAASLPPGADVVTVDGDFSSLVNPFHVRGDLKVRTVALEDVAGAVRPGTALVALSAAQSADGRVADLAAVGEAARAHGARTFVDASQAAGWLPLDAGAFDYLTAVAFKWLLCPRGVAFLTVPGDLGDLTPVFAGWAAGEEPWDSCYGPVRELARSGRRFDQSPSALAYAGAVHSLALVEQVGVAAVHEHDLALAARFRAGLDGLGAAPLPAPGSPIVSVPGLGHRQQELAAAGIQVSDRAGNLRAAFHLYNTAADVDRLLDVLAG